MSNFWHPTWHIFAPALLASAAVQAFQAHPLDDIERLVESTCHEQARSRGHQVVQVQMQALDQNLMLPHCDQPLTSILAQPDRVLGSVNVGVRCAGEQPWTIYVRATVSAQRQVPVLTRSLPRGTLLGADDLELVSVPAASSLQGVMLEPQQIIGMELVRSLDAGDSVKTRYVRAPKVVKRGQSVTLISGGGGLQVRMQGKALADAAAGDLVKATNLSSGQQVEGIVSDDGTVKIP